MLHDWFNFLKKLTFRKIVNYLLLKVSYFLSVLSKKPVVFGYPGIATVEPSSLCNLRCMECPAGNSSMTRPRGNLDVPLFKSLIDELSPFLSYLMLYFQGEPLLHPQLTELIQYATRNKVYTSVSTNGHQLDRKNARKIIEAGLDRIIISLDGIDQESYQKYRLGGDFNQVLQGVVNLVQIKKELHSRLPFVILQFIVMRHNENQIHEVKALGRRLEVERIAIKTLQVYDLKNNLDLLPVNPRFSRYKLNSNNGVMVKNRLRNRCRRLWHTMVILNDGGVVPCCFDKDARYITGKYPGNNIRSIWRGEEFNRFRQRILHSRRNIHMCCNCTEGTRGA